MTHTFSLFKDFKLLQMDVKSVILNDFIEEEEVYVEQWLYTFIAYLLLISCICFVLNPANNHILICRLVLIKREKIMPNNIS